MSHGRRREDFPCRPPSSFLLRMDVAAAASCERADRIFRSSLLQIFAIDFKTKELEQGLKLLDVRIVEITGRVRSMRQKSFVTMNSSTAIPANEPAGAMADFKRLLRQNQSLAARALSNNETISVAKWRPSNKSLEMTLNDCLYQTPQQSPFWLLNEMNHPALVPALDVAARQRVRKLCSYLAEQARAYNDAEMQWRSNLYNDRKSIQRLATRKNGEKDGSKLPKRGEHRLKGKCTSRTSLFSLDSSRSVVTRVSSVSRQAAKEPDADKAGSAGAPTRSRKALRDETSEHERLMSEILASSAKEARVERGAVNDNDLPLPLPAAVLTREDTRPHDSSQGCRRVLDPCIEERFSAQSHQWSDLEKCIFLDKFLQFPKNFGKIAAFFTRKRARDCARLYYDSKNSIDYKALLREHQQRRRGVRICWNVTAKAVEAFGGELDYSPQRNTVWFRLPRDNFSFTPLPSPETSRAPASEINKPCPRPLSQRTERAWPNDRTSAESPARIAKGLCSTSALRSHVLDDQPVSSQSSTAKGDYISLYDSCALSNVSIKPPSSCLSSTTPERSVSESRILAGAISQRKWSSDEKASYLRNLSTQRKKIADETPCKSETQLSAQKINYKNRLGLENALAKPQHHVADLSIARVAHSRWTLYRPGARESNSSGLLFANVRPDWWPT